MQRDQFAPAVRIADGPLRVHGIEARPSTALERAVGFAARTRARRVSLDWGIFVYLIDPAGDRIEQGPGGESDWEIVPENSVFNRVG